MSWVILGHTYVFCVGIVGRFTFYALRSTVFYWLFIALII